MHRLINITRSCKTSALCLAFLTGFGYAATAQQPPRLADSVKVTDAPDEENSGDDETTVATDSSSAAQAETDTLSFRAVPDSVVDRYKKNKDFAYANDPAYWTEEPVKREKNFLDYIMEGVSRPWFRILLYVLLGSVLLFALYKIIVENKLYLFYSSPKKAREAQTGGEDLEELDLEAAIQQAIAAGDFRSAVRYMHLKALKTLDEKGLIRIHAQATDQQYIDELQNHALQPDFRFLTRAYEHVWYGDFNLTTEQFHSLQKHFEHFYTVAA